MSGGTEMADQWVVVRVVRYGHEAEWLRDRLDAAGFEAWTPDTPVVDALDDRPTAPKRVMVRPADLDRASALLEQPWHERQAPRAEHSGALRTYQEWAAHRYDPGHYLGGTLEPHLRINELGPRARRNSAVLLAASAGVGTVLLLLSPEAWSWKALPTLAVLALYAAAAVRMAAR